MKRSPHSFVEAFTMIELLIVIACLGIIASLLLPALARRNAPYSHINCVNNLKQMGVAFRTWALDNGNKYPPQVSVTNGGTMELVESGVVYTHFQVMSNELSTPKRLICPEDAVRQHWAASSFSAIAGIDNPIPFCSNTNVSYLIGVDADDTRPAMLLTGDANIGLNGLPAKSGLHSFATNSDVRWEVSWHNPRHGKQGNIGLADGSVQQVNTPELRKALVVSGVTNRLAIPESP